MWELSHNKNLKTILLVLLFLSVIFVAMSTSFAVNNTKALGSTIYVATDGNDNWNGQYSTYQNGTNGPKQTIKNATGTINVNGQIYIADGQYKGTSNTGITIDHNMTITGESQSGTIIDGTGTNYLFIINQGVSVLLQDLTLTNGKSPDNGGAIQNNGDLTIKNCTIQKNTAAYEGGGIYNTDNCLITDSVIQYNSATDYYDSYGGGIENYYGNCILKNCKLQNNYADYGGGIDNSYGNCTIINCTIQNNNVKYDGAGISNDIDSNMIIINSTIQNNEAYLNYNLESYGGGIANNGNCNIAGSIIQYNKADFGGGICNADGTCTITDSKVNNNIARKNGGGLYNDHGTSNIINSTIQNNAADDPNTGSGGGIYNINSNLVINESKITVNTAVVHGGGIDNEGNIWIDNTQCISGNYPQDLYGFGTLQIIHIRNDRTNKCYLSVQTALDDAIADDTIILYKFIFNENVKINKDINLIGSGDSYTIINGQGKDACITIAKGLNVYITGLTIIDGTATNGGGICNYGVLTLDNVTLKNNHAKNGGNGGSGGNGGAIYSTGNITLNNCTLINNTAGNGNNGQIGYDGNAGGSGGAIYSTGNITINNSTFINNTAGNGGNGGQAYYTTVGDGGPGGFGGAIYNNGNLILNNAKFINNTAGNGGIGGAGGSGGVGKGGIGGCSGAIYNIGNLTITDSIFTNNKAGKGGDGGPGWRTSGGNGNTGGSGGAIYITGNLTLNNSTFVNNTAGNGGNGGNVIYAYYDSNTGGYGGSGGSGGAIYNNYSSGTLTLTNSKFVNNTAGNGGNCGYGGTQYLTYAGAGGSGGAIYNYNSSSFTLINSIFTNNTAGNGGNGVSGEYEHSKSNGGTGGCSGAIYNIGNLTITDSIFTNNKAGKGGIGGNYGGNGGDGGASGAIYITGNLILNNSTFINNAAGNGGNGVIDNNGGAGGSAGGIYIIGDIFLSNSTFVNNTAGNGGDGGHGADDQYSLYGHKGGSGGAGGNSGAIYSIGRAITLNSIFTNNSAGNGGKGNTGGVGWQGWRANGGNGGSGGTAGAINNAGTLNIINTTLTSNNAGKGGDGGYNGGIGGIGGYGGAIKADNMNITDSNFTNNTAMFGGAISASNNTVYINKCNFLNNKVEIVLNGQSMPVITINTGSIFAIAKAFIAFAKSAYGIYDNFTWGGLAGTIGSAYGIYQAFQTGIYNKTIAVGPPEATGGAINLNGTANLILINSTFTGQNASWGGAIYNFGNGTTLNVTGNTFTNNNAGMGGAIYSNSLSQLIVIQNIFKDNNGICGGAIFFGGIIIQEWAKLNATYNVFINNTGYLGGVLYNGINGRSNSNINYNRIYGINKYDIYNMYESNRIDAKLNWWGTNSGPGTYQTSDICHIDTTPYLMLVVTSNPDQPSIPKTITYGENATITADFLHNSEYYESFQPDPTTISPQDAIAFDGIPITFNIVNGGIIIPVTAYILNGKVEVTYIANGIIDTSKLVKIYVHSPLENLTDDNKTSTLINVNKIGTTTHMVYSQYKGYVGSNITLKAIVMDTHFNPVNEGNVIFWIGDKHIIVSVLNGYAICNWTIPQDFEPGNYSIYTTYNGTSIYSSSEDSHLSTLTILPSIYLTVTSNNNNPTVGDKVIYTIKVGNNGPDIAHDVVMRYIIPAGLEFINAKVDSGSYSYNATTRVLTWNIGDVPVGDPHMWLYLRIVSPGNYIINPTLISSNYNSITNVIESYTFKVESQNKSQGNHENIVSAKTETIGMQKTGLPITGLILAILMLLGGMFRRIR